MVEVRLLGRPMIERSDGSSAAAILRQPKRFALLAYLAVEGPGSMRRDTLLRLFWPGMEAPRARHALRQGLYFLKRTLDADATGEGELWCDAREFERLARAEQSEEAMRLYQGDLLEGFEVEEVAPELLRWIEETRARLRGLAADTAEGLSLQREEQGDRTGAVGWARRAAQLDPLNETRARRLLELLDREGSRAAALSVYAALYRRLQEQFALEPTAETLASAGQIRERLSAAADPVAAPATAPPLPSTGEKTTLVPERPPDAEESLLPAPHRHTEASRAVSRIWQRLAWIALGAVLGVAAVAGLLLIPRGTGSVSPSRIAVLPFEVRGDPSASYLRAGLVTLLSAGLDGAGDLSAADPDAVLRRTERRGGAWSPRSASRVARRLRSGMYVLGNVTVVPGDQLRVTASLYAVGEREPRARATADGPERDLLRVLNELTIALVAGQSSEPVELRSQPIGSGSLTAWKLYLVGLERLRSGEADAAFRSFDASVASDTTFALARYALFIAAERALPARVDAALMDAARQRERLPGRERDLLDARLAYREGRASEAEAGFRRATELHPNDEDGWYGLGIVLMDLGPAGGRSSLEARRSLERAAELDPRHVESAYRLARLELLGGDRAAAAAWAERGLQAGRSPLTLQLRALRSLAVGAADTLRVLLREGEAEALFDVARDLAVDDGDIERAEMVLRGLDMPDRSPITRLQARLLLADLALARGRWVDARGELARAAALDPLAAAERLALFSAMQWLDASPREVADARAGVLKAPTSELPGVAPTDTATTPAVRTYLAGLLSLRLGDSAGASRARGDLDRLASTVPASRRLASALAAAAEADPMRRLTLLAGFRAEPATPQDELSAITGMPEVHYLRATTFAECGRVETALDWLGTIREQSIPHLVFAAPAYLRQAEILLELGRREEARERYLAAARLWSDADPPLSARIRRIGARVAPS